MITLRNKLYESLLDDEDDLVNDDTTAILGWSEKFKVPITQSINKNTSSIKIGKNNTITAKLIIPKISGEYTLEELFRIPGVFKMLDKLEIHKGGLHDCIDADIPEQYDNVPDCVKDLKLSIIKKSDAFEIDFNEILKHMPNIENFEINNLNSGSGFNILDVDNVPTKKLKNFIITLSSGIINIDSIKGLNCDLFRLQNFSNKNHKDLIWIDGYGVSPRINPNISGDFNNTIDRFFKNNNVKQLVIARRDSNIGYEIIKINNSYKFNKIKL